MAQSRPYVTISAAMTIDGKIATASGDSAISSGRDLDRVHRLRSRHDAILVGVGTVLTDDPLLTVRRVDGPSPARIILDPAGRTPSDSRLLDACSSIPTILVVTDCAGMHDRRRLEDAGATILYQKGDRIVLADLLEKLYARNMLTLLVEGGGYTIWEFVAAGLFDEIILTVAPFVAGGGGPSLVGGDGFAHIPDGPSLDLASVQRQGCEVILRYVRR